MVFWSFSSSTHVAAMESSKSMYCSERWFFPSSKLKSRETLLALTCVAFIALSYLALASTPTSFYGSFLPLQIRTFFGMDDDEAAPKQYERRMQEVFDKAAMPNRTVIITTLNAAWAENNTMIDMFLESFQHGEGTQRLLQHLIIVCVDQKAYDRCLAIHSHCLKIKTGGVNFSGEQALLSEDYIKMIWRRIKFLKTVLEMDYSFIFTDADVLWFRDPFPRLQSDTKADLQMACDRYNGRPWDVRNTPNAGFTYVRANERTVRFYKYWYAERKRDPKMADQEVFNAIKYEDTFKSIGMNLHFLDTQFFGGFCGIRFTDMTKAVTMHATCCKGLGNKLIDLRRILEGWKEWQQHSVQQQASTPMVSPVVGKKRKNKGRRSSTKGRALVVAAAAATADGAHQQLGGDPHFKVPRACPRSWRSH